MVYKCFDKKSSGSGISNESNCQLANKLHKPIIRKFKKRKVYSSFKDNIWGADLADMQSLSKYNKGIKYLLCPTKKSFTIPVEFQWNSTGVMVNYWKMTGTNGTSRIPLKFHWNFSSS